MVYVAELIRGTFAAREMWGVTSQPRECLRYRYRTSHP